MTDKKEKEDKLKSLKKELEEIIQQRDEYLDGWKRSKAEFLNYKKEESKKIQDIFKYANEELLVSLIPVIDNFERAASYLTEEQKKDDTIQGIMSIHRQLAKVLSENGLEMIKVLGEQFDPNISEAIEEVEDSEKESGTVIEELSKGYKLNGKIIRAAQVKVAK